jgi:hypothetical protein
MSSALRDSDDVEVISGMTVLEGILCVPQKDDLHERARGQSHCRVGKIQWKTLTAPRDAKADTTIAGEYQEISVDADSINVPEPAAEARNESSVSRKSTDTRY